MSMASFDNTIQDCRQSKLPLLTVLLLVFIAVLPMIILRDFTPSNELRYLSIADESLSTGRWWAFTNHGIPYADKPPLYLWCVILGKWLLGSHQMWFLSLFSIIPAFVIGAVMFRWTRLTLQLDFQRAALLMLFTCGLFAGMVFTLRMDMLMTMFIVLAFYQFRKLTSIAPAEAKFSDKACAPQSQKPTLKSQLLFAIWIFLAVFSKGPMGILIPLVATTVWLFLTRRMRLWTRAWGWPTWILLILLCALWFGAVYAEGGTEYLDNLLVHQTVGRAVNSFHHKRPFWYYLVSLTYTTQPWTFLIFGAVVYGIRKFKRTVDSLENFFLIIILSTFVLLSVISSKLQVYMLPAYPFMVYLAMMVCARNKDSKLVAAGIAIPAAILGLVALAEPFVTDTEWFATFGINLDSIPAIRYVWYALFTGGFLTLWYLYKRKNTSLAIETLAMTVLTLVFVAGISIRSFNADLGYKAISETAMQIHRHHPEAQIIAYKLDRPENIDAYLQATPFKIVESSDSLPNPAIIMTKKRFGDEIPDVDSAFPIGTQYTLLLTHPSDKSDKSDLSDLSDLSD